MKIVPAAFALIVIAVPAFAAQTVSVPPFKAIEVHGGGHVTLHHGQTERVVLLKGDPKIAEIRVNADGSLVLSPCGLAMGCPWHSELDVEVTMPEVTGLAVHGGGAIEAVGPFPHQSNLAVAAHGGGTIDARAIHTSAAEAAVHGGGEVKLHVDSMLTAAVHGGGVVRYWGNPQVVSAVHGGGEVVQGH